MASAGCLRQLAHLVSDAAEEEVDLEIWVVDVCQQPLPADCCALSIRPPSCDAGGKERRSRCGGGCYSLDPQPPAWHRRARILARMELGRSASRMISRLTSALATVERCGAQRDCRFAMDDLPEIAASTGTRGSRRRTRCCGPAAMTARLTLPLPWEVSRAPPHFLDGRILQQGDVEAESAENRGGDVFGVVDRSVQRRCVLVRIAHHQSHVVSAASAMLPNAQDISIPSANASHRRPAPGPTSIW